MHKTTNRTPQCVSAVVVVDVVVLALALTVFKVKQPRLAVNNVWLTAISAGPRVAANATLTADVSIENPNPNAAAFRFSRTESPRRMSTTGPRR